MADTKENGSMREMFLRTVAVVGLLAVLILGAWGIIVLATSIPAAFDRTGEGFSSIFNFGPRESLEVSAPASATSGQALPISWEHTGGDGEYRYTISYACANAVAMRAPLPSGGTQNVECDKPFNYTGASSNISLTPMLDGTRPMPVTISVASTKLADNTAGPRESTTVTINPAAPRPAQTGYEPATTTTKKPTSTYVPAAKPATQLYGKGDLRVSINEIVPGASDRVTVMFTVENAGTNVINSGWSFEAEFPWDDDTYTYSSPAQQKLMPGDKIVFFLGFDENKGESNYERFTVIVDSKNRVQESNEGNNAANIRI